MLFPLRMKNVGASAVLNRNVLSGLSRNHICLIFFVFLLSFLFFIGGPDDHSCRSFKAVWNLGHLLYYAILPLLIFSFPLKIVNNQVTRALIVVLITLLLGVLVEIIQNGLNRTPDVGDLYRNMLGASVAILFFLPNREFISRVALIALKGIVIILILIQLVPVGIALVDEQQARFDYPILADFQTPFQAGRWTGRTAFRVVNTIDRPGNYALDVTLTTAKYSGANLKYFPEKWEPYTWFEFSVYNPSMEPLTLICRIHDKDHNNEYNDRFNRSYLFAHGWNSVQISLEEIREAPEGRQMDLTRICSVTIFAVQLPHSRHIRIDDLKLF